MYDSINFRLLQNSTGGDNFLKVVPHHLCNVGVHNYNGHIFVTGDLDGLQVGVSDWQVTIKNGSICKWYLGDNFKTMGRHDTQMAVERLSDTLHIPVDLASITRIDIAQNFILRHPVGVYFEHLGTMRYATRLEDPNGIYYKQANGLLCFYDKVEEQKHCHKTIPELYSGRNVLRYEQRYTKRIASQLGVQSVTGSMLYNEEFYISLIDRWRAAYKSIQKINDMTLNLKGAKTKQQLYKMGIVSLIDRVGGLTPALKQVEEEMKKGSLTRKQAYDLKQAMNDAMSIESGLTTPNEAILELDKKVNEAVKFYR